MASQEPLLGPGFLDFIATFMRAINTARLYASGHDLFKKNIQTLHQSLLKALAERPFLFIGCARESVFLEGDFYPAKDTHLRNFLKLCHDLGISHLLLDRKCTAEELDSLLGLLAGAKTGQGEEVLAAMPRENIRHAQIGLLDYSIFTTVQAVASQIALDTRDEVLWRQLILQPAAAAAFHLTPERIKQLTRLSEDLEELKKLLLHLDAQMKESRQGISAAHRGAVLGNFILNIGRTLEGIDPERRKTFARQVGLILAVLEPALKTQILGSVPPDAVDEEQSGVLHEIFLAIPDSQVVTLLADALKEGGGGAPCFNNLFRRAMVRYTDPGMLLTLIRQEMHRATQERRPGMLNQWQQLEQLLMREQELKTLNEQYHQEIQALATSIQLQRPMVEEEERGRLLSTLRPESLTREKAKLIIEVIRRPHGGASMTLLPPLLERLNGILTLLFKERDFQGTGILLREIYLALGGSEHESLVRGSVSTLFNGEEVGELLKSLLSKCRSFEPKETVTIDAICQLFADKAGNVILDLFLDLKAEDSPAGKWILATLGGLGPALAKPLTRRLRDAPEGQIPRLLDLAVLSGERSLGLAAEALLEQESLEVRLKAISTLGILKVEHAVDRLKDILLQKSWLKTKKVKNLQTAAAQALSMIGTEEAGRALEEVSRDGSGDLRELCRELSKTLGERHARAAK